MGASASTLNNDMTPEQRSALGVELLSKCEGILKENPGNRCCKHVVSYLSSDEGKALSNKDIQIFYKCIKTGLENPSSSLGCYAMTPRDYTTFTGFFDKLVRDYHGDTNGSQTHVTDWTVPEDVVYDVRKLGLNESSLSTRVRVSRNLKDFDLPGKMSKQERVNFERKMLPVFDKLTEQFGGGAVISLTPDFLSDGENPNLIAPVVNRKLTEARGSTFEIDTAPENPYLASAGIYSDWPYGRGRWTSSDGSRSVRYGGEDHLRIVCVTKSGGGSTDLAEVFDVSKKVLDVLEGCEGVDFARDDKWGYVTSCPSNLGTGMRASVRVKIPNLMKDGGAMAVCEPLGLSAMRVGGEGAPIDVDGTVDISPSKRLFVRECDIIKNLYEGIEKLMRLESAATVGLVVTVEETVVKKDAPVAEDALSEKTLSFVKNDKTTDAKDDEESTTSASNESPPAPTEVTSESKPPVDDVAEKGTVTKSDVIRRKGSLPPLNTSTKKTKGKPFTLTANSEHSMATASPRTLNMSPSPTLAIMPDAS